MSANVSCCDKPFPLHFMKVCGAGNGGTGSQLQSLLTCVLS